MKPHFFLFKAKPSINNPQYENLLGAYIRVWVIDEKIGSAEIRAREYLQKYLWELTSLDIATEMHVEQLSQLGKQESDLYQKVLKYGISAAIHAWKFYPDSGDQH